MGDAVSLPHEFAHGLYEMVPDYRMDVDEVLDTISPRLMEKMKLYLMDHQYANVERILRDEVHAYLLDGSRLGCSPSETYLYMNRLRFAFLRHGGKVAESLHCFLTDGS